ncbi:MAG: DUF7033 domain-containing protein, partial [Bacteroidota bacterium]
MILKDHLGLDFIITDKKNDLINFTGPKICYSPEYSDSGSLNIKSENLLFETGVRPQNVSIGNWDNVVTLYHNESSQDFSFDIFSASFFLVTRYEEYIPHIKDQYDRFESESSIAYSHGFLDLPI